MNEKIELCPLCGTKIIALKNSHQMICQSPDCKYGIYEYQIKSHDALARMERERDVIAEMMELMRAAAQDTEDYAKGVLAQRDALAERVREMLSAPGYHYDDHNIPRCCFCDSELDTVRPECTNKMCPSVKARAVLDEMEKEQ